MWSHAPTYWLPIDNDLPEVVLDELRGVLGKFAKIIVAESIGITSPDIPLGYSLY